MIHVESRRGIYSENLGFSNFGAILIFGVIFSALIDMTVNTHQKFYISIIVVLFIFSISIKQDFLPALGLMLFCFCPVAYMTVFGFYQLFSPANVILAVILIKGASRITAPTIALAVFFIFPLILLSILTPNISRSLGWTITFGLMLFTFTLKKNFSKLQLEITRRTATYLIAVVGSLALVEKFLHWNPFISRYSNYLSGRSNWDIRRITTSLGHPITNGLVFCTLLLLLVVIPSEDKSKKWDPLLFAMCITAILLSDSRAVIISLVVAVIALLSIHQKRGQAHNSIRKFLRISPFLAILAFPLIQIFLTRNSSKEGVVSFSYRFALLKEILADVPNIPYFGYGPGLGSDGFVHNGFTTILENGIGQLIYALGIIIAAAILFSTLIYLIIKIYKKDLSFIPTLPWLGVFLSTNTINDNITSMTFLGLIVFILRSDLSNSAN